MTKTLKSKRSAVDHDVPNGKLSRCQITGSTNLFEVIDLGHQPPCDSLLSKDMLDAPEKHYPLRLMHCPESGLSQLDYVIDGSEIYYPDYHYRSGISKPLEIYQRAFADSIIAQFAIAPKSLCVDIGCNDGTLLTGFKRRDMEVVGVEPTNIAQIARKVNKIEAIQSFFTESVARDIVADYGHAKVITMTNVFAHMAPLGEVMRGLSRLIADDGIFVTESQYLLDVLEKNQFDGIYHEHIRTYSLKSSRQFPTPMAWETPQYRAKRVSKSETSLPRMYQPESTTRVNALMSSARCGAFIAPSRRKGSLWGGGEPLVDDLKVR